MTSTISTLSQTQIASLLQSEQSQLSQPINNWTAQIKSDQTQLSAWGKVAGAMSSLDSAVNAISDPTSFDNRSATSSDQSVATATVKRGASAGSYSLSNVKLAQTESLYSNTYASGSTSMGSSSGSLVFNFGSGSSETVKVSAGSMTLKGVAQAINQVSGGRVTANLVGGTGGERLVLTGNQTGSSQSFAVSGKGGLSQFQYASGGGSSNTLTQARAARDATLNVNGVPLSSASNTLTGAIPSGSVTLSGSGSTTVSVAVDASKLSQTTAGVINKLNSAVKLINKETAFSSGSGSGSSSSKSGPLLGDYSASNMANKLESAVSGLSTNGLSGRDMGITVNKDGTVSFDSGSFNSAYKSNPSGVENLVKQLYTQVQAVTSTATNSAKNGIVDEQKSSLNNTINSLQNQIQQQNQFVQSQMQIYQQQYTQLLNTQQNYTLYNNYLNLMSGSGGGSSHG